MSILINEAYANDTIPLWASNSGGGGGGNAPTLVAVNTALETYSFEDNLEHIIQEVVIQDNLYLFPNGLPRGFFSITASFGIEGAGFNETYNCIVREGASGLGVQVSIETLDYPLLQTSGSLNWAFLYTPGDDYPQFQQVVQCTGGTSFTARPCWTITFYPMLVDPVTFPPP